MRDVTVETEPGTVRLLLGANGAGKSSLLNGISGMAPVKGGSITLGELQLDRMRAHRISQAGVLQVPEGRRMVAPLTVAENLQLGQLAARGREGTDGNLGTVDAIYAMFPALYERRAIRAGQLSGGEQQMLALGRALMGVPRVILLDEPTMGLSPKFVDVVLECVRTIAAKGIGVLMVEQNVAALDVADYVYLMRLGEVVSSGPASEYAGDERIVDSYLGVTSVAEVAEEDEQESGSDGPVEGGTA
ncbi:ABC transporter ATP-binding protein [Microbacterium sp.]|uniref:ABC transporter ATP-binding protein n=1 Tax=Microbacterium sp. TaxID=51671 RepID=UPI0039E3744F